MHQNAQAIAPKVNYEWEMFNFLAKKIESEYKKAPQEEKNLLMEGFLLHVRVLLDFFIGEPKKDDVSARHFYKDESVWTRESPNLCTYLRDPDHRKRVNKKLAHLTYSRLTEKEEWDFPAIRKDIDEAWKKFQSLLDERDRDWFS